MQEFLLCLTIVLSFYTRPGPLSISIGPSCAVRRTEKSLSPAEAVGEAQRFIFFSAYLRPLKLSTVSVEVLEGGTISPLLTFS